MLEWLMRQTCNQLSSVRWHSFLNLLEHRDSYHPPSLLGALPLCYWRLLLPLSLLGYFLMWFFCLFSIDISLLLYIQTSRPHLLGYFFIWFSQPLSYLLLSLCHTNFSASPVLLFSYMILSSLSLFSISFSLSHTNFSASSPHCLFLSFTFLRQNINL